MDKNEVITLSSDEEQDNVDGCKVCSAENIQNKKHTPKKIVKGKLPFILKASSNVKNVQNEKRPEVVDLVEGTETVFQDAGQNKKSNDKKNENFSNDSLKTIKVLNTVTLSKDQSFTLSKNENITSNDTAKEVVDVNNESNASIKTVPVLSLKEKLAESNNAVENNDSMLEDDNKSDLFYNEFVELCGSFENNPTDKKRLMKKLRKRYQEADTDYVRSEDFKNLVEKNHSKLHSNNLYLIAKEVSDELNLRKKIVYDTSALNQEDTNDQRIFPEVNIQSEDCIIKNKKELKLIRKIVKKLDKMGKKIRKLEEAEVDLSDEENSTYVKLQRYRERFFQVYKKLCEHTKELGTIDRLCNRKIVFNGSKYPAINKCIEKWLNKTKRFPDFNDVMKLLESQSATLELPLNKESIRIIASEIFQEVGVLLQRKRKYELWDSFCGFLEGTMDPAEGNPNLEKVFKENFDTRIKKEQEIINYYAEKQERDKLEPEEVPEEEANYSPVESGNEDEDEIECIENSINKKLTIVKGKDKNLKNIDYKDIVNALNVENNSNRGDNVSQMKESKNNFKNCKSLKWRLENSTKSKSANSEKQNAEGGNTEDEDLVICLDYIKENKERKNEPDLELILEKPEKTTAIESEKEKKIDKAPTEEKENKNIQPQTNLFELENFKNMLNKKRKNENGVDGEKISDRNILSDTKKMKVFDVHCCQIEHNFERANDIFSAYELNERKNVNWEGKIFRDLTNINRLMKLNRKKQQPSFLQLFHHRRVSKNEKSSWKKRIFFGCKLLGLKIQKCPLNQDNNLRKKVSGNGGDSKHRNVQKISQNGGDEAFDFHGGSGSDEDNNEKDNNGRKNGNTKSDGDESKDEEDEEEEKEQENEKEDENENKNVMGYFSAENGNDQMEKFSVQKSYDGERRKDILKNSIKREENQNIQDVCTINEKLEDIEENYSEVDGFENNPESGNEKKDEITQECWTESKKSFVKFETFENAQENWNEIERSEKIKKNHIKVEKNEDIQESRVKEEKDENIQENHIKVEKDENVQENCVKDERAEEMQESCVEDERNENVQQSYKEYSENDKENGKCALQINTEEGENIQDSFQIENDISRLNHKAKSAMEIEGRSLSQIDKVKKEEIEFNEDKSKEINQKMLTKIETIESEKERKTFDISHQENEEKSEVSIEIKNDNNEEEIEIKYNIGLGQVDELENEVENKVNCENYVVEIKESENQKTQSFEHCNAMDMENKGKIDIRIEVDKKEKEAKYRGKNKLKTTGENIPKLKRKIEAVTNGEVKRSLYLDVENFETDQNEKLPHKKLKLQENVKDIKCNVDTEKSKIMKNISRKIVPTTKNKMHEDILEKEMPGPSRQKEVLVGAKRNVNVEIPLITLNDSVLPQKGRRRMSAADEERVKRFLLHSPSSISITLPKNLTSPKPPSSEALKAIATLRNLKGISATRVRKIDNDDDVQIIPFSCHPPSHAPVISKVTTLKPQLNDHSEPSKTLETQCNTNLNYSHGSYNPKLDRGSTPKAKPKASSCDEGSSFLRISNVRGGLSSSFCPETENRNRVKPNIGPGPLASLSQTQTFTARNCPRKGPAKKTVECVILD